MPGRWPRLVGDPSHRMMGFPFGVLNKDRMQNNFTSSLYPLEAETTRVFVSCYSAGVWSSKRISLKSCKDQALNQALTLVEFGLLRVRRSK